MYIIVGYSVAISGTLHCPVLNDYLAVSALEQEMALKRKHKETILC